MTSTINNQIEMIKKQLAMEEEELTEIRIKKAPISIQYKEIEAKENEIALRVMNLTNLLNTLRIDYNL